MGWVMVCFAVLGALGWYVEIHVREHESITRLILVGLFAGVGAFLLVQGGKQVFLNEVGLTQASFNPWTSAVLAFFAGMTAYRTRFLTRVVDQAIELWSTRIWPTTRVTNDADSN